MFTTDLPAPVRLSPGSPGRARAGAAADGLAGRLQRPGRRPGRPAAGRAGQRRARGAAHRVRQRGIQRPARGQRVRRAAPARGRHHRPGAFHRRCAGQEGAAAVQHRPAQLRRRRGARRVAAGGACQRARRPGADRAETRAGAGRRQGRVAAGVRPAELGRAHHPGRHQDGRGGAAHGAPEPRLRGGARADQPAARRAPTSPPATWSTTRRC